MLSHFFFFEFFKFVLSPGAYAAGPCYAEVLGAEALPGVGAFIRAERALAHSGQHQSCCLNPMWFIGVMQNSPGNTSGCVSELLLSADALSVKILYVLF